MKAVVSSHCTNEHGQSPDFCEIEISVEQLQRLEALQALCVGGIVSITADTSACIWESVKRHEELRLWGSEVVVSGTGIWFRTYAKHQDGHIETNEISLADLRADFDDGKELVFCSYNIDELTALYEDATTSDE